MVAWPPSSPAPKASAMPTTTCRPACACTWPRTGPQDAPPVLCLHGWPQHWLIWRGVWPALAGEYRVICPDLRGHGWSGWPDDGDFRKARLADDAVALLDVLGLPRAHVIGHDWGGWTGLLMALDAPERVQSLLALSVLHPWQPRSVALRNALALRLPDPARRAVAGRAARAHRGLHPARDQVGLGGPDRCGTRAAARPTRRCCASPSARGRAT